MPRKSRLPLRPLNLGKETIGQRLARLRKERGYTQRELADRIGIIHSLISDYEKGKLRLYDQMVARFALALEVSTDTILGLQGDSQERSKPSLKILRRLTRINALSVSEQKALLKTIDMFLKAAEKGA
jgi:transcriptional regulator with XRE-family HTH domain